MQNKNFSPKRYRSKEKPFCVYDIETSTDLKRVYLVGWYDGKDYRYWESEPLPPEDPRSAISQFAGWFFSRKRDKCYAHNGGNFDHLFLLKWIMVNLPTAHIEMIPTQSSILLMTVMYGGWKYEFLDSMRLMPGSLEAISQSLLGEGKVGDIDYETLHLDPRRYEYLQRDCTLLYRDLVKWREVVVGRLNGAMGLTAASTAIATVKAGYLDREIAPLSEHHETIARDAYYGGRTEVFCKTGGSRASPIRCYDVNSMYVWALALPLPIDLRFETEGKDAHLEWQGFVECTVDTSAASKRAKRIPVLPYRDKGKLLFPLGRFSGTWTTPELRAAVEEGYKISHVKRCIYFDMVPVFSRYVETLYKLRDKSRPDYDDAISRIAKVMGNSTYGKFGTNREREKIHVRPSLEEILERGMRPMQGPLDLPVFVEETTCEASYILPHLAAWITSIARLRLLAYMYQCSPHRVFYCDTDSVYTTATISTGPELGGMKEEYSDIISAEFLAPKTYRLIHADGHETVKAKGFSQFGRGNKVSFPGLKAGEGVQCSAMSKCRTILRGDFGLMLRTKHLLSDRSEKRIFSPDGSSIPIRIGDT
jgi:hypothetical protein